MLLELSKIISMLGATPLAMNGGEIELLHGLVLLETSPGKKASGSRKIKITLNAARLIDCS
jgi:hypothetical protein